MSDDLLKRATAALAEEYDGASAAPGATRSRVLSAVADQRRKGRKRATWGIPLLVVLSGSTAWAGASGKLPAPVQAVVDDVFQRAPVELAETPTRSSTASGRGVASQNPAGGNLAPVDQAVPADDEAQETPATPAPILAPVPPTPTLAEATPKHARSENSRDAQTKPSVDEPTVDEPVDATPQKSPELELYKEAHRAHFDRGDHSTAERGYARYLAAAPSGIFAAEARYNRGVCLIRLGRTSEAQTLLRPFAEGSYGGYRQDEARALLDAMAR